MAIWILVFHIDRRLGNVIQLWGVSQLVQSGNFAVDIFMFLSGYCLYQSFDKNPVISSFYRRRVIRLLPSYCLIAIPFWLWRSHVDAPMAGIQGYMVRFLANASSATFWLREVLTTWFVFAIFAFYLIFPFLYRIIKKGKGWSAGIIIAAYLFNIVCIYCVPIYSKSSIAWSRLPVFIMGAAACAYPEGIDLETLSRKSRTVMLSVSVTIPILLMVIFPAGTWILNHGVRREYMWMLYGLLTPMIVFDLMWVVEWGKVRLWRGLSAFLRWAGGMSIEIYMTHIILLNVMIHYDVMPKLGIAAFLLIPVISLLWASAANYLVNKMCNRNRRES